MANLDAAVSWLYAHEGLPTGRLARRLIDNGEIERILSRLHCLQPRLESRPVLGRFFAEVTKAIGCIRNCRDFEQVIAVTRRVQWLQPHKAAFEQCAHWVWSWLPILQIYRHGTHYQGRQKDRPSVSFWH